MHIECPHRSKSHRPLKTLAHIRQIRSMAREPHREGLVAMGIVPTMLIRIVKQEFYKELVEHFVKDDSRSEESSRQSALRGSSPEIRT